MAVIENDTRIAPVPRFAALEASFGRIAGIAVVVALHVGIVYAVVNGLAQRAVEVVRAPIVTRIIDEAPAPKPEPPPPTPAFRAPPVAFVPPPDIRIEKRPPAPKAITAVATVKPPPSPPIAAPVPAPAPAAPPHEAVRLEPRLDLAHSREPEYPPMSRRLGEQGFLLIEVLVDEHGRAVEAKLAQSSGFPRLDQAALGGIKDNYRFAPGMIDGKPAPMRFTFKFTWKLR